MLMTERTYKNDLDVITMVILFLILFIALKKYMFRYNIRFINIVVALHNSDYFNYFKTQVSRFLYSNYK